jgi:hypothetical protein
VKPKPIIKTGYLIACFSGDRPRYLCKDRKHGHYVVTLDDRSGLTFDDLADAQGALDDYQRSQGFNRDLAWSVYRMNSKITLDPIVDAVVAFG